MLYFMPLHFAEAVDPPPNAQCNNHFKIEPLYLDFNRTGKML
jgi:hypothetical protein